MATDGPLTGIKVVDLTRLAPGPFATMLLGDLGADVITVEPPPERTRSALDDVPAYGAERARAEGLSPMYRSRRSIVVDLKQDTGRDIVLRLADTADVFLEGFRPGTVDRLGVSYDAVRDRNPRIVYGSVSGYGQDSELAHASGHDLNYLAEAGVLSGTTRGDGPPGIPFNVVADFAAGGLVAAFGILAALRGRDRTGTGTYVDVSMYQGLLALIQTVPPWTAVGAGDPSWGQGLLTGACPYYDCYRTADDRWLSVAALEVPFFVNLLAAVGRSDLEDTYADPDRWDELRDAFTDAFASARLDDWLERLAAVDTAVAPVRSVEEAFALGRDRGLVQGLSTVGPLPPMSAWQPTVGDIVARPGTHTRQILAEHGWNSAEIDGLLASGAAQTTE